MTRFLPWTIRHVALENPLPDLDAEPGVGGLFLVFWYGAVPLGHVTLPAVLLPISAAQLAATVPSLVAEAVGHRLLGSGFDPPLPVPADRQIHGPPPDLAALVTLARPLQALAKLAEAHGPSDANASVSIVVCTRNRPDSLERCLRSFRALSPAAAEVIVVDNDPATEGTRQVTDRFPEVRYVPEPRPGLSIARNTGVRHCSGALIAFTDDDVIVHPGWVAAMRAVFREPDKMAMTGLVLPAALATPAQQMFQTDSNGWGWGYRTIDFDERFFNAAAHVGVPVWRMGAGANMAFRREAFDSVGFFDERLGAGASGCSEDSELWYRLLAAGHRCRYSPSAVVFHHHRADWAGFREQSRSYMRGHVTALLVQFERHGHWGNVYRAFLAVPWHLAKAAVGASRRRVGRLFYGGDRLQAGPVAPSIMGALSGYFFYLRHRAPRPGPETTAPSRPGLDARGR